MKRQKIRARYKRITEVRFLEQLGFLIRHHQHTLILQSMKPKYHVFYVRKRNGGGKRLIENPAPLLKAIQVGLNRYLQAAYYFQSPRSSHGFEINIQELCVRSEY